MEEKVDIAKVMEKIHKLLALAGENGLKQDNINEGSAAMKKAMELMDKHGLRFAEFQKDQKSGKSSLKEKGIRMASNKNKKWVGSLIANISKIFSCEVVILWDANLEQYYNVLGYPADIELLTWYFNFLKIRIGKLGEANTNGVREKESYCYGVCHNVVRRLKEMYKKVQEQESATTTALVIAKNEIVTAEFAKKWPRCKTRKVGIDTNNSAYAKGFMDGDKIPLNKHS